MDPVNHNIGWSLSRGAGGLRRFAARLGALRRELAARSGAMPVLAPSLNALRRIEAALVRPLRIAVLGESNSGKSTLTNLLLGVQVLPTLEVPNTRVPTLLTYGERAEAACMVVGGRDMLPPGTDPAGEAGLRLVRVSLPLAHLTACEILDVPGFLDPILEYDVADIGGHGIDAAIWCTFSTQAWKESERFSWLRLPLAMRRHGLLTVTNMDRLRSDQRAKVIARLEKAARPDVQEFAFLAAPEALSAFDATGTIIDPERWEASGAAQLHRTMGALLLDLRAQRLRKAQDITRRITQHALKSFAARGR